MTCKEATKAEYSHGFDSRVFMIFITTCSLKIIYFYLASSDCLWFSVWWSCLCVCVCWMSDEDSGQGTFTHLHFSCSLQRGKRLLLKFLRETPQQQLMWTREWSGGCLWVKVLIQNNSAARWNHLDQRIGVGLFWFFFCCNLQLWAEFCLRLSTPS